MIHCQVRDLDPQEVISHCDMRTDELSDNMCQSFVSSL